MKIKFAPTKHLFILFICIPILTSNFAAAAKIDSETKIRHNVPPYFKAGYRISLKTNIQDSKGVTLARCYFKYQDRDEYLYVPMQSEEQGNYHALLAAPSESINTIEYLFLVVNSENVVRKSTPYIITASNKKPDAAWLVPVTQGTTINIFTEVKATLDGDTRFSDSVSTDITESTARFGTLAGLYEVISNSGPESAMTAAGSQGDITAAAGTGAVAGGTAATVATASTSTIVIAAVATAAVAGGAIAAVGSGSDGNDSNTAPASAPEAVDCADMAGIWNGRTTGIYCDESTDDNRIRISINEDCSGTFEDPDDGYQAPISVQKTSADAFNVNGLTSEDCGGPVSMSGTYSGNTMNGTYSYATAGGGTFSATR